ncbi:MAG TPA: hypothetical protein DEG69_01540 [Flavobacteriaceae bacterium]|nr:hypothetical protein [Flavobacteriaceae bacterium]|tara:strand:- start:1573 stop:1812 length:240 start_codon:yes stop_codon:yes gene_type:complete
MITKYASALDIKLEVSSIIHDHNIDLMDKMEKDEITYEEYKRLAFPTDCIALLDKAINKAFDKSKFACNLEFIKVENAD